MTERGASKGPVSAARARSSSRICVEVLSALDRMYATEGPDEPDLGLNVAYMTARTSILRLASATPWEVPVSSAALIREAIASISSTRDSQERELQLLSFPVWAFRLLDRRRADRDRPRPTIADRRAGDRERLTRPAAAPLALTST